jgi:hypothetical protein
MPLADMTAQIYRYVLKAERRGKLGCLIVFTLTSFFFRVCRQGRRFTGTNSAVLRLSDILADRRAPRPLENCRRDFGCEELLQRGAASPKAQPLCSVRIAHIYLDTFDVPPCSLELVRFGGLVVARSDEVVRRIAAFTVSELLPSLTSQHGALLKGWRAGIWARVIADLKDRKSYAQRMNSAAVGRAPAAGPSLGFRASV